MASKKKIVVKKKKLVKKKAKKKIAKKKVSKKKNKKEELTSKHKVNRTNLTGSDKEVLKIINGRPRIISSPEEMDNLVNDYINNCIEEDLPFLLTGMILHLGLSSRVSFDRYAIEHGTEFSYSVKRAKMLIERGYEMRLHGTTPTGSIFALKNFGWFDKTPEADLDNDDLEPMAITFEVSQAVSDVRVTKGKKKT